MKRQPPYPVTALIEAPVWQLWLIFALVTVLFVLVTFAGR